MAQRASKRHMGWDTVARKFSSVTNIQTFVERFGILARVHYTPFFTTVWGPCLEREKKVIAPQGRVRTKRHNQKKTGIVRLAFWDRGSGKLGISMRHIFHSESSTDYIITIFGSATSCIRRVPLGLLQHILRPFRGSHILTLDLQSGRKSVRGFQEPFVTMLT